MQRARKSANSLARTGIFSRRTISVLLRDIKIKVSALSALKTQCHSAGLLAHQTCAAALLEPYKY